MNSNNKTTSYGVKFAAFAVLLIIIAAASVYSTSLAKEKTSGVITAFLVNPLTSPAGNNIFIAHPNSTTLDRDTTSIKKGKRTLKFYDDVNGEKKKFKAILNNGMLEELYVDGKKIPDNELNKYENKITERLNEYDSALKEFSESRKDYKEKMKSFREKMKKFRGDFSSNYDFDFDFDIPPIPDMDTTVWKRVMKEIQENLNESFAKHPVTIPPIHIPKIDIPSVTIPPMNFEGCDSSRFNDGAFKESMKEWIEKMKDFEFNNESFKESMKEWKEKIKDFKFDMKKFDEEMKRNGTNNRAFNKSMEELKVNMDRLKVEMKKLKEFIREAKDELVKDKLIDEDDDLDDFTLSKDEMIIDGKKVSSELHKKYLELYKKHYGKDLKDEQKINF